MLPTLGLRWAGYRQVHRTVCKRLRRRLAELGLDDLNAYRGRLAADPAEMDRLAALCRIPISRFFRDRAVFEALGRAVLPALAKACLRRRAPRLRAWSCGCASGEEPYSLSVLWHSVRQSGWPSLDLLATDADAHMLVRARRGCYPRGSLRELSRDLMAAAFEERDGQFCIRPPFRAGIAFQQQDVRVARPDGPFDLILCRNLVFTYFERLVQAALLDRLVERLVPGGALVIGRHEGLPAGHPQLAPWLPDLRIYRRMPEARR